MLTAPVLQQILDCIAVKTGDHSGFRSAHPVGGGSINQAFHLQTNREHYFVKLNHARRYPGMFEAESEGLRLLSAAEGPKVPEVFATGVASDTAFILMQWLEPGRRNENYSREFGRSLAELHRSTDTSFGLDHDNYIGSLSQSNRRHVSGASFFIEERLYPQAQTALRSGALPASATKDVELLMKNIPSLLPDEKPSLLHGDLWNGNAVTGPDGKAWLIDPAVYYGFRETDLAMTRLFGGFEESFYEAYNESFPLAVGWQSRIELFNLYPLLVHVNLFGGSYAGSFLRSLRRYL